jgi:hypothetical protein
MIDVKPMDACWRGRIENQVFLEALNAKGAEPAKARFAEISRVARSRLCGKLRCFGRLGGAAALRNFCVTSAGVDRFRHQDRLPFA